MFLLWCLGQAYVHLNYHPHPPLTRALLKPGQSPIWTNPICVDSKWKVLSLRQRGIAMLRNVRIHKIVHPVDDVPKRLFIFSLNLSRISVGSEEFQTVELITFKLYIFARRDLKQRSMMGDCQ